MMTFWLGRYPLTDSDVLYSLFLAALKNVIGKCLLKQVAQLYMMVPRYCPNGMDSLIEKVNLINWQMAHLYQGFQKATKQCPTYMQENVLEWFLKTFNKTFDDVMRYVLKRFEKRQMLKPGTVTDRSQTVTQIVHSSFLWYHIFFTTLEQSHVDTAKHLMSTFSNEQRIYLNGLDNSYRSTTAGGQFAVSVFFQMYMQRNQFDKAIQLAQWFPNALDLDSKYLNVCAPICKSGNKEWFRFLFPSVTPDQILVLFENAIQGWKEEYRYFRYDPTNICFDILSIHKDVTFSNVTTLFKIVIQHGFSSLFSSLIKWFGDFPLKTVVQSICVNNTIDMKLFKNLFSIAGKVHPHGQTCDGRCFILRKILEIQREISFELLCWFGCRHILREFYNSSKKRPNQKTIQSGWKNACMSRSFGILHDPLFKEEAFQFLLTPVDVMYNICLFTCHPSCIQSSVFHSCLHLFFYCVSSQGYKDDPDKRKRNTNPTYLCWRQWCKQHDKVRTMVEWIETRLAQ